MLLGLTLLAMAAGPPSDLSGYWTNLSVTGLQRPADVPTLTISDERAAEVERDENDPPPEARKQVGTG